VGEGMRMTFLNFSGLIQKRVKRPLLLSFDISEFGV